VKLEGKLSGPNGVCAVLFDLDGTLRNNKPSPEHTFFDFAAKLGVEDSPDKRRNALRWVHYYWAQSKELMSDMNAFSGFEKEFWQNYASRLLCSFGCADEKAPLLAPEMSRYMKEEYHPQDTVEPEVYTSLQNLKEAGYKLGVVSNRTHPYDELLNTLKLTGYFDCIIAAGLVSAYKPEPEIFGFALRELGIRDENALYIGDNYFADVVGAERAGITPVLLDPEYVFPEAGCSVIRRFCELNGLLDQQHPNQHSNGRPT
jgi:putative hydrolase of the HAD superfamily